MSFALTSTSLTLIVLVLSGLSCAAGLSTNYTNAVLRAALVVQEPYVFCDASQQGNARFSGFAVDFVTSALAQLNQNVTWVGHLSDSFGSLVNGNWTGAVGELVSGQADIIIAPLTVTSARSSVIDFTAAYVDVGLEIMILRPSASFGVWGFFAPFTERLWGALVATIAAMAFVFYAIDRLSPYGHYINESRSMNVSNSFMTSAMTALGQGADSATSTRSWSSRILWLGYIFFAIIIISTYTANLTAFLTVKNLATTISDLDSLRTTNSKFGVVAESAPQSFFIANTDVNVASMIRNMVLFPTLDAMMQGLQDGKVSAVVWANVILDYLVNQEPCNTMIVGDVFNKGTYGIPLPQGSPLLEPLSIVVLQMRERGEVDDLVQKWYLTTSQCPLEDDTQTQTVQMDITNLAGLYYLLLISVGISVLVLVGEYALHRSYKRHGEQYRLLHHVHDCFAPGPGADDD